MTETVREKKKPLVAYDVQGDEYGCVIFADCNVVARREGASELDIGFNEVTSCRRLPGADKYAEHRKVPMTILVEEFGWWQECGYCSSNVCADENVDRVWEGENIFCDKECQQNYHDREARYKAEREAQMVKLAEAKELAIARFPGITNVHAYREWDDGHRVYFDFPGGKRSASWLVGQDTICVSECDVETGKAFIENVRAQK